MGTCIFSWFGQCINDRRVPGEIEADPTDRVLWDNVGYARVSFDLRLGPEHTITLSLSPTFLTRTGDEREQADPSLRDPLTAQRDVLTFVTGLAYNISIFDDRVDNTVFAKQYTQLLWSEEPLPGGTFRNRDQETLRFGVGNQISIRLWEGVYAKASYEFATRLPRPEEYFGDGFLIIANLDLVPEEGHNVNLGLNVIDLKTDIGTWQSDINLFLRDVSNQIILLGNDRVFSFQNVFGSRSLGAEGSLIWTDPGGYFSLGGQATYADVRNTSSEGTFGDFDGDRIPNRPFLFGSATSSIRLKDVVQDKDLLRLTYYGRFVEEFFRGWESVGNPEFKQTVDAQLTHALVLVYQFEAGSTRLSFAAQADNITNADVFDFFGIQRPGRSFFSKVTASF